MGLEKSLLGITKPDVFEAGFYLMSLKANNRVREKRIVFLKLFHLKTIRVLSIKS